MHRLGKQVLKGVSRSFYVTLRLLPGPMRGAASLGYLLARVTDTLADSGAVPLDARLACLDSFSRSVAGKSAVARWPMSVLNAVPDERERHLLESAQELVAWLQALPEDEALLVQEVIAIIVSGQRLDLERFAKATRESPVTLLDEVALDDYTWRVAGCVGAFWTELGFLTLGDQFSKAPKQQLLDHGVAYGKGLQRVNILRDVAADLAVGRCYLPVADPHDPSALLECHQRVLSSALEMLSEGESYAKHLVSRRLRAATVLPARLGRLTLEPMRGKSWLELQQRLKLPRSKVYQQLIRATLKA
jgi:farnesyl-diphosphate farnesyltransferase